jgi:hypothetical protein
MESNGTLKRHRLNPHDLIVDPIVFPTAATNGHRRTFPIFAPRR